MPLSPDLPTLRCAMYAPGRRLSASPAAMVQAFWENRDLIWQMIKREVLGQYRGSLLGLAWSFFNPLLLLGAYTFALSYVMKVGRPSGTNNNGGTYLLEFAFYAFAGLVLLGLMGEVANRAPSLILQHTSFVKKVVFPLEVLPFVQLGAAAIHAGMSILVLVLAQALLLHHVPLTLLLTPLVILPLGLLILGMAWMLAALGVFLRDVGQVIGILIMMLMYLSPVFYRMNMIDAPWARIAILLNPLTIPLVNFRHVALEGVMPEWRPLGIFTALSVLVAWLGFWSFQRFRRGFADVL